MRRAFSGHGASRGNALGRARLRITHPLAVAEASIEAKQVESEIQRLHDAIDRVREEMHGLREQLHGALAAEVGEFLDMHALLLDDPELLQGLDELIRQGHYSADYALRLQRDRLAEVFAGMDDAYLRSRQEDIDHVIGRIHAALHDHEAQLHGIAGDILIADAIAPAELAQLQAKGVLAIVTAGGSTLSHTAILARSLHLPLITGAADALHWINDGDVLAVDGGSGEIILEPDAEDLRRHHLQQQAFRREQRQLNRLRREPSRSVDGIDIKLWANAETSEDVAHAHSLGAAGVGLYRTEFLFMGQRTLPDETTQFRAYRDLVLGMTGRTVTIRTLDLGADKADDTGLALRGEPNPALGLRGVRLSLARPDVLDTQLRAIARASGYGPVRVLVPMVSCASELADVRLRLQQAVEAVRLAGHDTAAQIPLGAMIEVPSAALGLPGFIDQTDFISVGTNDLVQYLLAVDRTNESLAHLYTPLHPAVLLVLHGIFRTANQHGVPVSVCGEMAGDALLTPLLLALGLREFSLHPGTLLEVRRAVRGSDIAALQRAARRLRGFNDPAQVEHWLQKAQPALQ